MFMKVYILQWVVEELNERRDFSRSVEGSFRNHLRYYYKPPVRKNSVVGESLWEDTFYQREGVEERRFQAALVGDSWFDDTFLVFLLYRTGKRNRNNAQENKKEGCGGYLCWNFFCLVSLVLPSCKYQWRKSMRN